MSKRNNSSYQISVPSQQTLPPGKTLLSCNTVSPFHTTELLFFPQSCQKFTTISLLLTLQDETETDSRGAGRKQKATPKGKNGNEHSQQYDQLQFLFFFFLRGVSFLMGWGTTWDDHVLPTLSWLFIKGTSWRRTVLLALGQTSLLMPSPNFSLSCVSLPPYCKQIKGGVPQSLRILSLHGCKCTATCYQSTFWKRLEQTHSCHPRGEITAEGGPRQMRAHLSDDLQDTGKSAMFIWAQIFSFNKGQAETENVVFRGPFRGWYL